MNKLSDFIQCFGDVKDAYLVVDNAGSAPTRLVISYEYFGREEKRRDRIEAILADYVPRLMTALLGKQVRLLVNAAQEDGLFELRFELLGEEPGHFIIYNVPVRDSLLKEFAAHNGEEIEIEFRAVNNYLVEGVVFPYSFSEEEYEMVQNGGFVDINPAQALAQAAVFNEGILDPTKRNK